MSLNPVIQVTDMQHRGSNVLKGTLCAIHKTTHSPKSWGKAFRLTKIGASFATKLYEETIEEGAWVCSKQLYKLEKFILKETTPTFIDCSNDFQPSIKYLTEEIPDVTMFDVQQLLNFVNMVNICAHCGKVNTLMFTKYSKSGADSQFEFTCAHCKVKSLFDSSHYIENSKSKYLSTKIVCASQLSGIQHSAICRMMAMMGMPYYSNENSVYHIANELWENPTKIIERLFESQLKEIAALKLLGSKKYGYLNFFDLAVLKTGNIGGRTLYINNNEYYIPPEIMWEIWKFVPKYNIPLYGSVDGRWSKPRNANECTVILNESIWKVKKESKPKLDPATNQSLISKLSDIFEDLAAHADSYTKSANTQKNESLNNSITRLAPKRNDFSKNYVGRVDMALLCQMEGEEQATVDVMNQAGFPLSPYSRRILRNIDYKLNYHQKRKREDVNIKRRKYMKEEQKRRHKKLYSDYKYKESEGPSQENLSQDTMHNITTEGCSCRGACKTKKCTCKRNGRQCGSNCHTRTCNNM